MLPPLRCIAWGERLSVRVQWLKDFIFWVEEGRGTFEAPYEKLTQRNLTKLTKVLRHLSKFIMKLYNIYKNFETFNKAYKGA